MRYSTMILAILALGLSGAGAMARTEGSVDAYQGVAADSAITSQAGGTTIGNPPAERDAVMARLDERRFTRSNDTMEGEPAGGTGMGGSTGGVGSR
jgi:hypothetical protein